MSSVQSNEHTAETCVDQIHQGVATGIEQMCINAHAAQRLGYALARHQRDLPLCGSASVQYPYTTNFSVHAATPNCPGTRLTQPAPLITATSPSRATSRTAYGSPAPSSTSTGAA